VRELEHLIGRSALKALAAHRERPRILTLTAADLTLNGDGATATVSAPRAEASPLPAPGTDFRDAVTAYERTLILDALKRHNQNWASAARELGLDRANLNRLARRLGLK
jgi:anaerobic nitric oxide reductase transcription regulator